MRLFAAESGYAKRQLPSQTSALQCTADLATTATSHNPSMQQRTVKRHQASAAKKFFNLPSVAQVAMRPWHKKIARLLTSKHKQEIDNIWQKVKLKQKRKGYKERKIDTDAETEKSVAR